jgi:hypothetical protein
MRPRKSAQKSAAECRLVECSQPPGRGLTEVENTGLVCTDTSYDHGLLPVLYFSELFIRCRMLFTKRSS